MLKELSIPYVFSAPRTQGIRTSGVRRVSLSRRACVFGLVALNIILLFVYILGVNAYASTGYQIKFLQNNISQLSQENKKLNMQISERASVANLETELSQSGYMAVQSPKFLQTENQYSQK